MAGFPFQFFNPEVEVSISRGHLPHWDQGGATYFITWRTADSLPAAVWNRLLDERSAWLIAHGIDSEMPDWRFELEQLSEEKRIEFARMFSSKLNTELDCCHGECLLRSPVVAEVVAGALHHFDGDRHMLGDFVIMPNHVHLLVGGMPRHAMLKQVKSWKKWSALQINKLLGRKGRLWQDESFDHLVRSRDAFAKFQRYIAKNPGKARLKAGEYVHWTSGATGEAAEQGE